MKLFSGEPSIVFVFIANKNFGKNDIEERNIGGYLTLCAYREQPHIDVDYNIS